MTRLPQVGLQIWRGALLLSDFILQVMRTSSDFDHVIALELGAGTGLVGLVMARVAPLVFMTDRGAEILDNCSRNVICNANSLSRGESTARVRELDWQKSWPPPISDEGNIGETGPYKWTQEDIRDAEKASVLLAADVVYSPDLTAAFFNVLKALMPRNSEKVLYLAMEKRYNFSLTDLDIVAHGYKHFRTFFDSVHPLEEEICSSAECEVGNQKNASDPLQATARHFYGKEIDASGIRQYVTNYDRGKDLELWEIRAYRVTPSPRT